MSRAKSKAQLAIDARYAFVRAVVAVLKIVGARCVEEPPPCPAAKGRLTTDALIRIEGGSWDLDLEGNVLHVAPYANWIACRFENEPLDAIRTAATVNGQSLNPFSFKWNWHWFDDPGEDQARRFGEALCSFMPLDKAAPLVERLREARLL